MIENSNDKIYFWHELILPLGPLLIVALGLRLIPFFNEPLINSDGIAYILQAKALYLQEGNKFLELYPYLTNISYLIAGIFHLIGNWVLSAQLLSLGFSLLTIIPLYYLSRLFWDKSTSIVIVIFYTASPLFVELSSQIIRGPQFWFFLTLGLFCFCRFLKLEKPTWLLLSITAISFLLAAWSRIEGALPLLLTGLWLILHSRSRTTRNILAYFLPLCLLACCLLGVTNINLADTLTQGVDNRIFAAIDRFNWLRDALNQLEDIPPSGTVPYFFSEVKDFLWLLGLGVTAHSLLKTFGIIFFLLTLFGMIKRPSAPPSRPFRQPALTYLLVLISSGILLIYMQIFLNWCGCERFVAFIYFPGLILVGFGARRLQELAQRLTPTLSRLSYVLIPLFILAAALPQISKSSHLSRSVVFKEFGGILRNQLAKDKAVTICGTSDKILLTHFYAHIDHNGTVNPWNNCTILKVDNLKPDNIFNSGCDYLILSDRDGGRQHFLDLLKKRNLQGNKLGIMAKWQKEAEKYGTITLFSLKPAP